VGETTGQPFHTAANARSLRLGSVPSTYAMVTSTPVRTRVLPISMPKCHTRHAIAQQVRNTFADTEVSPAPPVVQADRSAAIEPTIDVRSTELPEESAANFRVTLASQFASIPPESERWFWRSLLLAAIEARWEHDYDQGHSSHRTVHGLLWATVYHLRAIPRRWHSEDVESLRERLTPGQRITIARFLTAILQDPIFADKSIADMASQAIHGCWRDDPASTQAAKTHHMALRSYRRPTHDSQHYESRILAIEHAFAGTPYLTGPLMNSGWEEPTEYELAFQGTDWRQLTPRLICHNFSAFSFMTPDAFRSFIPAVLCHELGPGSAVEFELYRVDHVIRPSSHRDEIRQRVEAFTPDERWAIVSLLNVEAMMNTDPETLEAYEAAMTAWELA
jgi:hypothetical protein